MRVTKIIREYVEKAVYEKIPMPTEPTSIIQLREEWETLVETIKQDAVSKAAEFFIKHKGECAPYYHDNDFNDTEGIINYITRKTDVSFGSSTLSYAARAEYKKACSEVGTARKAAIDNILVTLELGGNKADLDAMLANL